MTTYDSPEDLGEGRFLPPIAIPEAESLSVEEKAVRDLFVTEYLVDYDGIKAAMRCGFQFQFAVEYSKQFLQDPYVQKRISDLRTSGSVNQETLDEYNRRRVREALMEQAFYQGPGASHAARVAALGRLTTILGMDPSVKGGANGKGPGAQGGVMAVPGIADIDQWEQTASQSQDELVKHASTDQ